MKKALKNVLPNILTLSRGIFALLMIWGYQAGWSQWWLIGLLDLGALSDFLDGYLARKWRVVSDFGKTYDAFFDKLLIWASFVIIALDGNVFLITVFSMMIVRDFFTDNFKGYLQTKGITVAASKLAKFKTVLEFVVINLIWVNQLNLINWSGEEFIKTVACLMVVVSLVSGYGYLKMFWSEFRLEKEKLVIFILSFFLSGYHVKPKVIWVCLWSSVILYLFSSFSMTKIGVLASLGLFCMLSLATLIDVYGRTNGRPTWLVLDKLLACTLIFIWSLLFNFSVNQLIMALVIYTLIESGGFSYTMARWINSRRLCIIGSACLLSIVSIGFSFLLF